MSVAALMTIPNQWRKVLTTNSTSSAFVIPSDVATVPSGAGYVDVTLGGQFSPNTVLLKLFGAGADDSTGSFRVYGVRKQYETSAWDHTILFSGTFILSTAVGVAGGLVSASERYADTVARVLGIENIADQILSPTGNIPGWAMIDLKGFATIYVEPIVGTATNANALWTGV